MILHTYQPENFDITKEISDYKKSDHYQNILKDSYDWLFARLKTQNVIWCYPASYFPYHPHGETCKRWTLDVPESEAVAILNRDVWDSIIGKWFHVPERTYNKWIEDYELVKDTQDYDEYIDKREEEFKKKKGPNWNERILFRKKLAKNYRAEVLIPSPVKEKWVVDTTLLSFYDTDHCSYGGRTVFDSEEDANRYIEITTPLLKGRKIDYSIAVEKKDYGWIVEVKVPDED